MINLGTKVKTNYATAFFKTPGHVVQTDGSYVMVQFTRDQWNKNVLHDGDLGGEKLYYWFTENDLRILKDEIFTDKEYEELWV